MDFGKLIERVKNILLTPKTEWPRIAAESDTVAGLYTGYALILAAIPALGMLIGTAGIGFPIAIVTYVITLVVIFIASLIVNALAPTFGGQKDSVAALKVVVYSSTPGWVAGIFNIIPFVGPLIAFIAALYGIYVLYLGLSPVMKNPEEKSIGYTALIVVCYIVLMMVFMGVVMSLFFGAMMGGAMLMGR